MKPGQIVVRHQAAYLAVIFAVDLVQQLKAQQVLADADLVAVVQPFAADRLAVNKSAVL